MATTIQQGTLLGGQGGQGEGVQGEPLWVGGEPHEII